MCNAGTTVLLNINFHGILENLKKFSHIFWKLYKRESWKTLKMWQILHEIQIKRGLPCRTRKILGNSRYGWNKMFLHLLMYSWYMVNRTKPSGQCIFFIQMILWNLMYIGLLVSTTTWGKNYDSDNYQP